MPNIYRYSRKKIVRCLGGDAAIWVNPAAIEFHVGKLLSIEPKFLSIPFVKKKYEAKKILYRSTLRRSFIISRGDFTFREPITGTETYKHIDDYVKNRDDFRNSIWYKSLLEEIVSNGESGHKKQKFHNRGDLDNFFLNYVSPIYESFKTTGYDCSIGGIHAKCYIDHKGQVMKGPAGRHRLAFAKILKLDRFPLLVHGVHEDWYTDRIGKKLDIAKLGEELKAVASKSG